MSVRNVVRITELTYASLCLLQILGICGSVIAAAFEITTILTSGPLFSVVGVAVACAWRVSRSLASVVFGLSAALISLFIFLLINAMSWGPADAKVPVTVILLCYEVVIVPLGIVTLKRLLVSSPTSFSRPRWQFDLQSLLILTAVAAVLFTGIKIAFSYTSAMLSAVAIGVAAATLLAIGIVVSDVLLFNRTTTLADC